MRDSLQPSTGNAATSKLARLVSELSEISLREYPDLPASMYIPQHDPSGLQALARMRLPPELTDLYCTSVLVTEPWTGIKLYPPQRILEECSLSNQDLVSYSPPMKVEAGVRAPVQFGENLVPFAYQDDSLYCVDLEPDETSGGTRGQVVNVSLRKGRAKVVYSSLEAFLRDGLRKMRREIERRHSPSSSKGKPVVHEESPAGAELLRDAAAYWQKLGERFVAGIHGSAALADAQRWTAQERERRAMQLLASNPKTTPLQQRCAKLVEGFAQHPDFEPALRQTLPPMPIAEQDALERSLGVELPTQLRQLLNAHQRIGVPWGNIVSLGVDPHLPRWCEELSAIEVPDEGWSLWPGTAAPVFGKGLVPLAGDGDPVICLDLLPGPGGHVGQIVEVSFEEAHCKVIAGSLQRFLAGESPEADGRAAE